MSDTPRHDDHEGQPYSDPTAPGDDSFFASSPTSAGTGEGSDGATSERADAGATDHTEQLPTSGDTQQVPAPETPAAPPASPYAQPNPYAQPYPTQDELQQRRAHEQDATGQAGYEQAPAGGSTPPPPPPGYGTAPTPPAPGANPYGSAPYGSAPYGSAPYGSAPSYATPAHGSPASLSGSTIALLVVSGLLTLGGCGTGIPALVFAILAVTKKDEPAEASKWTRWGWIALGITVAIVIVGIIGVFALAVSTGTSSGY